MTTLKAKILIDYSKYKYLSEQCEQKHEEKEDQLTKEHETKLMENTVLNDGEAEKLQNIHIQLLNNEDRLGQIAEENFANSASEYSPKKKKKKSRSKVPSKWYAV